MSVVPTNDAETLRALRGWEWATVAFTVTVALAAVAAVAAAICWYLGAATVWPAWAVLAVAIPGAGMAVSMHIGQMGNDMMDVLVGSIQVLILTAILFSVFGRAADAHQRNLEKPLPQPPARLDAPRRLPHSVR